MYERVTLTVAVSERDFFDRLNDTIAELCAMYGEPPKLLWKADESGEYPSEQHIRTFEADKNSEGSLKYCLFTTAVWLITFYTYRVAETHIRANF